MKKTITILLLTALCMMVLTSCDTRGGLVAELFGGTDRADEHLYPIEDCIEEPIGTEITPGEPIPPVEIQTAPPYEIETEYSTAWNTTAPAETEPIYSDIGFELNALPHHTAPIKALLPVNAITLEDWQELDCAYYHGIFDFLYL